MLTVRSACWPLRYSFMRLSSSRTSSSPSEAVEASRLRRRLWHCAGLLESGRSGSSIRQPCIDKWPLLMGRSFNSVIEGSLSCHALQVINMFAEGKAPAPGSRVSLFALSCISSCFSALSCPSFLPSRSISDHHMPTLAVSWPSAFSALRCACLISSSAATICRCMSAI